MSTRDQLLHQSVEHRRRQIRRRHRSLGRLALTTGLWLAGLFGALCLLYAGLLDLR
jgi:fatty acid desaturase